MHSGWRAQLGWISTVGLLAGATAFSGLGCGREACVEPVEAPPPQRPVVAAPRPTVDNHLIMFGELAGVGQVPFQSRASSPMKQHTWTTDGADFDVVISPDGKQLVFSSTRHSAFPDLYLKSSDGQAVTQLTSDPASDISPSWSRDGKQIAFASNRAGNWDIWIIGLDGGQARQVTSSPQHELHPSFSPDGKRLVYCAYNERSTQWELWTLQLDLPGSRKMIGIGLFPEWSPTGDSILYQRARERGSRCFSIWRLDLVMGEPKYPVELVSNPSAACIQPRWSPDGGWITYTLATIDPRDDLDAGEKPATRGEIWIVRPDGSSPMQLTDGRGTYFGPAWGGDNRVYFTSSQADSENIWSIRPGLGPAIEERTASNVPADTAANVPVSAPRRPG